MSFKSIQTFCLIFVLSIITTGCKKSSNHSSGVEKGAVIVFRLLIDQKTWEDTNYGEPPQIAIWIEQPDSGIIKTIWVTSRTATGRWRGKVICPTSLPYWVSRYNEETGTNTMITITNPLPDALTGATPSKELIVKTTVPPGTTWKYFIEVNASGDYNDSFPPLQKNGHPDPDGNGQPSLVYSGKIKALIGQSDVPILIGRTDQWDRVDHLITDLTGINSAKNLLREIRVSCTKIID